MHLMQNPKMSYVTLHLHKHAIQWNVLHLEHTKPENKYIHRYSASIGSNGQPIYTVAHAHKSNRLIW